MEVPETIECIDCGQPAHRLSYPPEDGWEPGDMVAYRCSGCNDRWDMVVGDDSGDDPAATPYSEAAQAILRERRDRKEP